MYKKLYEQITDALVNDGYIVIQNALDSNLAPSLHVEAEEEVLEDLFIDNQKST